MDKLNALNAFFCNLLSSALFQQTLSFLARQMCYFSACFSMKKIDEILPRCEAICQLHRNGLKWQPLPSVKWYTNECIHFNFWYRHHWPSEVNAFHSLITLFCCSSIIIRDMLYCAFWVIWLFKFDPERDKWISTNGGNGEHACYFQL